MFFNIRHSWFCLPALLACCLGASWGQSPAGAPPFHFVRAPGAVVIDGKLDDWVLSAPVSYEVDANAQDRLARSYGMWDDQYIYLAYVVQDSTPMKNTGDDPSRAFKTGDSLHFYFSTDAEASTTRTTGGMRDFHVLMTMQRGKPVIFAFRERKAGTDKPISITSPATKIDMDWMGPVPGAEMAVVVKGGSYTAEVKLPLAFFDDFHPAPGRRVGMDVAVNFSDPSGTTNLAKVWWHRGASQILDVPSELRFERNLWGDGAFLSAGELPIIIDNSNFYAVPVPGPVTIDGDLSDWDLSCAYGPHYVDPMLKDHDNITWAAMYDANNLYLGAIFHSSQPIANGGGVNNVWWQGDSLEFRFAADTLQQRQVDPRTNMDLLTFALWYNPTENKDYLALQRSFAFVISDTGGAVVKSKAIDGGRSFEARIPWTIVRGGHYPKAGDAVAMTLAAIWKNGLRSYGMGSISSFRGLNDWGQAHFLRDGRQKMVYRNLRPPEIATAPDAGKYPVTVTTPAKGLLSAGVYSTDGRLLRTLCAGKAVDAGAMTLGWDGKDDDGAVLPPGKYAVRALDNAGMHAQYVTSATSPGKPPHASDNARGGWGGVWGNVLDIAADASGLYPIWSVEEGDGALLHCDEDGNLLWRQHVPLALPGLNTAAASNGKYVYVAVDVAGKEGSRTGLWRVRCADGSYAPFPHEGSDPLAFFLDSAGKALNDGSMHPAPGLAADMHTLFVAAYYQNQIQCLDAETGKLLRTIPTPHPSGVCLDGINGLLVVSEQQILHIDLTTGRSTAVVTTGLDAPYHVTVDMLGQLLVTDRGVSQQVKRFNRAGQRTGIFGIPGGRDNQGKFQVNRLRNPAGITVTPSGKVFYSEDAAPKIFVRLSATLQYEKLWAGPWYISGEVCVDPQHPEYLYSWGGDAFIRHLVDYRTHSSQPDAVWEKFALESYGRWFPRVIHHAGNTYIFCGGNPVTLYRIDGYRISIVTAISGVIGKHNAWVYTDLNDNGKVDVGEKLEMPAAGKDTPVLHASYWSGSINERDLTIYLHSGNDQVWVVTPTFTRRGVPVYNLASAHLLPLSAAMKPGKRADLSSIWQTPDGGVFGNAMSNGSDPRGIGHSSHLSDVFVYRLDRDGKLLWRAGKKASGIARNGEFYGRACGLGGPIAGKYFDFVDENGQDKVYSDDGLFVGNLLDDGSTASPSANTLNVEHFNSMVYQNARDQRWYFVAGASGYASIWEIAGLDKISRLQASVEVK